MEIGALFFGTERKVRWFAVDDRQRTPVSGRGAV
jgi:hypothetical protein